MASAVTHLTGVKSSQPTAESLVYDMHHQAHRDDEKFPTALADDGYPIFRCLSIGRCLTVGDLEFVRKLIKDDQLKKDGRPMTIAEVRDLVYSRQ